jgi:hypothetical protein
MTLDLVACQTVVFTVDGDVGEGNFDFSARLKCPGPDLGGALGTIATGSTAGTVDSYKSTCGGVGEPDVAWAWTAPSTGRYVFDTRGSSFDTVLAIQDTCAGAVTACNNDDPVGGNTSAITQDLIGGQSIVLIVDGDIGGGAFKLDANRKCPGLDLGSALGPAIATGDTSLTGDSYTSSCGGGGEPDAAFTWTAPASAHYHIATSGSGFDTVLAIHDTCTGPVTACNNDDPAGGSTSAVDLTLTAGQVIIIVIDGDVGGGAYQLGITKS